MRTRASASAPRSAGTPRASLPNSHSTGPASSGPSSSRAASPAPSAASTVTPAARSRGSRSGSGAPRTTSTWNRLPALERTALPPYGSADPAPKTTAPARQRAGRGAPRRRPRSRTPRGPRPGRPGPPRRPAGPRRGTAPRRRGRPAGSACARPPPARSARSAVRSPFVVLPRDLHSGRHPAPDGRECADLAAPYTRRRRRRRPGGGVGRRRRRGCCWPGSGGLPAGRRGGDGRTGGLHQRGEGGRLVDGQLGQHAAVELDAGELEALHEPVVGHVVLAGRGVDAGGPQLAEVTLADLAVAVLVGGRVEDLLLGLAVQPGPLAAVAAGRLEGRPALLLGVDRPLHACHWRAPSRLGGAQSPSSFLRLLVSAGEMTWSWSSRRLRREDLCSNLCWLLACSRMSFPLPVTRTHFAVPLCVFCFGMSSVLVRVWRRHGTWTSRQLGGCRDVHRSRRPCVWWCGPAAAG